MSRWELRIAEPGIEPRTMPGLAGLRIGRHADNDLVLDDTKASAFHAELREDAGGSVVVADVGSTNKTRVEAGPILGKDETHSLSDGLRIFIGRTTIKFADLEKPMETRSRGDSEVRDPEFAAAETVFSEPVSGGTSSSKAKENPASAPKVEEEPVAASDFKVSSDPDEAVVQRDDDSEITTVFRGKVANALAARERAGISDVAEFRVARPRLVIATDVIRDQVLMQGPQMVVGRSAKEKRGVTCRLNHDAVSSVHATISFRNGRFMIQDQGSTNGTYVGHDLVPAGQDRELRPDVQVRFGTVDTLWVTDTNSSGDPIPPQRYRDALEILVGDASVTALVAKRVTGEAVEKGMHPGEVLLVEGRISVSQWCDALARVPSLSMLREQQKTRTGGGRLLVALFVLTVLALAAIWFLKREWLGLPS